MEATIYRMDGTTQEVAPQNGENFRWEELRDIVDGYIEVVQLNHGMIMVVNEEGKFTKDTNVVATIIAQVDGNLPIDDWIAGDVLVCDTELVK